MASNLRALFLLAACLASLRTAFAQDSITLRPAAALRSGPVHLADIADLGGAGTALGQVTITTLAASAKTVSLAEVRDVLDKQPSINWGRLTLAGAACKVRVAPDPAASTSPTSSPAPAPAASPAPAATGPTVRSAVARKIAETLAVNEDDLRLTFDNSRSDILDMPTDDRVVAIQPLGASDKMSLSVTVYRADAIIATATIRVATLVKREVRIARVPLYRGQVLTDDLVSTDTQFLPATAAPAPIDKVIGTAVRSRIEPGAVVLAKDIESPVVVKKGDKVTVDCISGTFVVRTTARALESGREGQEIRFVVDAPQTSRRAAKDAPDASFTAKVQGPGRAIVLASSALP